jgi:hypothetical protein
LLLVEKLSAGRMDEPSDTHPSCLDLTSNQQQLENQMIKCGNQRYRRELLMMGIMVPETF